jgi:hypothetical protein
MPITLLRSHKRLVVVIVGLFCLVFLVSACAYWRIWSFADLSLYLRLRYHSPVAQALWRGAIRPRDPMDLVIAMSRPNSVRRLGPFLRIDYYPGGDPSPGGINLEGTSLTAKDGQLISAGSYGCTFQRTYFDVATAEEKIMYERLIQERLQAIDFDTRQGQTRQRGGLRPMVSAQ